MKKRQNKIICQLHFFFPVQTHKIIFLCILFLLQKNQTHAQHTPQTNKEKVGDENMMKDIYLGFFLATYINNWK